jgi:hypothetical protein
MTFESRSFVGRAMLRRILIILVVVLAVPACGRTSCAGPLPPDTPVPAGEPRASLRLKIDLTRESACDETFDLAIYQDRGVDLIVWDEAKGRCNDRVVTIRYLPKRVSRDALMTTIRKTTLKAEILEG